MTKVLTIRIDADLLGKAEARTARLGLDRAKYVRSLIEEDLAGEPKSAPGKFASDMHGECHPGPAMLRARE